MENQYAPPGYFAPAAPKPSKAAVMIFYMSVAFCIIGCIMIIKGVFKPNLKVTRATHSIRLFTKVQG